MNGIADNENDFIGPGREFGDIKRRVVNCGYTVRLGTNSVRLVLVECFDRSIQVADVLFAPFNFQSDAVDSAIRTHALRAYEV